MHWARGSCLLIFLYIFFRSLILSLWLIWLGRVLWPFELHLEPLRAYLEAVHGGDRGLRRGRVIERHKAKTLRKISYFIYEHLR